MGYLLLFHAVNNVQKPVCSLMSELRHGLKKTPNNRDVLTVNSFLKLLIKCFVPGLLSSKCKMLFSPLIF